MFSQGVGFVIGELRAVPYLVPRGTRCRVITPQGRVIDPYVCRENTTFTDEQTKPYGLHLQFERDGYRLIAAVQAVVHIEVSCADCGRILPVPSLCDNCARLRGGR